MFRAKALSYPVGMLELEKRPGQEFVPGPETYCVLEEQELTDQRWGDFASGGLFGVFVGMLLVWLFFYLEKWIGR